MKKNIIITLLTALLSTALVQAEDLKLPEPDTKSSHTNFSKVLGWPEGKTPTAPAGFTVKKYASDFKSPRNIYVGPNGDIFIAEAQTVKKPIEKIGAKITGAAKSGNQKEEGSANRITLLRDKNGDGIPETQTIFLSSLDQPYGMLILGKYFYVANQNAVIRYVYNTGDTKIKGAGTKILDLPEGKTRRHWTRNLTASPDGKKIYVAIGSGSNVAEDGVDQEIRRATILEINPDGSGEKTYASGIRNPAGLSWSPETKKLWTAVNERDELGDDLVPDYLTEVKEDGFYGWPYAYWGTHADPRMKGERPDLVKKSITPDLSLGAHTASLGLAFYDQKSFPAKYLNGAFIGQHGSWNRKVPSGYKVVFIPFKNGKPSGPIEDFLTGFMSNLDKNEVYGRPVAVAVLKDGSLLVSDDVSNALWNVKSVK